MIKKVFIGTSKDIGVECKFWALKNIPNGFEIVEDMDECDIFLSVQYGKILSRDFLKTRKCYNFHPNILPYYGGVGTLSQSILNDEEYSGITLHEIDSGIDTGKIIHQIRADLFIGDSPSSIGNRLIKRMTETYCKIIIAFEDLVDEQQPSGKGRLYLTKHFDADACKALYQSFKEGMIEDYIEKQESVNLPYIVRNTALRESS